MFKVFSILYRCRLCGETSSVPISARPPYQTLDQLYWYIANRPTVNTIASSLYSTNKHHCTYGAKDQIGIADFIGVSE